VERSTIGFVRSASTEAPGRRSFSTFGEQILQAMVAHQRDHQHSRFTAEIIAGRPPKIAATTAIETTA
jgi:hypothetical protein